MRERPALALAALVGALAVSLAVGGCGGGAVTPAPASPAADPAASAPRPAASEPAEAAALRRLAFAYWDAYNAYEPDAVLAMLEPGERVKREPNIRDEIGRLKTFGVKLGITEKSPPVLTGPDTAEILVTMKEPLGSRTMKMVFLRNGEGWLVTGADEVPK